MRTIYYMERASGYGQYKIVKKTPKGKITKVHSTDSQLWDRISDGYALQKKLASIFKNSL